MRNFMFFVLLAACASGVLCAPRQVPYVDSLGPATQTTVSGNNTIAVASSTVSGVRNCLTHVSASASRISSPTNLTLNVLDVGTTIYVTDVSSGNAVEKNWPADNPLCIAPNHALNITLVPLTAGTTTNMNYMGYSY